MKLKKYEILHSLILIIIDLKHWKRRHIERLCPAVFRGPTSWAVPVDGTGTMFVEAVKVPPVLGVQKPPCRVRKRFQDCHVAAPMKEKAKKLAGLKTRPAWLRQDRLGASPAVCCGNAGCQAFRLRPCKPKGG